MRQMKKWLCGAVAAFSLFFVFQPQTEAASLKDYELAEEVFQYIQDFYIEPLDEEMLEEYVIEGIVNGLGDPYTHYISPEMKEYLSEGSYIGIGIEYSIDEDDQVKIVDIYEGTSADEAGIQVGDYIVSIDGQPVEQISYEELHEMFTGEKNTEVMLGIERNGEQSKVTVKRHFIERYLIHSAMLDNKVGYIQLLEFHERSGELFAQHLQQLKQQGMKKLVLDLRDNGGGYINVLDEIARQFWDKTILMHTIDRNGVKTPHVVTGGTNLEIPMVVLVNEGSASASEILAGALQDHDRATIIGTYTYGKARMQDVLPLSNDGMLMLTSQAYLTPDMHDIQDVGIEPDLYVEDYYSQMFAAFQELDVNSVTFVDHDDYTLVNGLKSYYYISGIESFKDRYYVSLDLLSYFVPMEAEYDQTFTEVVAHIGGKDVILKQSRGEFIVVDSQVHISVPYIHQWVPNFNVTTENGNAVLTFKK